MFSRSTAHVTYVYRNERNSEIFFQPSTSLEWFVGSRDTTRHFDSSRIKYLPLQSRLDKLINIRSAGLPRKLKLFRIQAKVVSGVVIITMDASVLYEFQEIARSYGICNNSIIISGAISGVNHGLCMPAGVALCAWQLPDFGKA